MLTNLRRGVLEYCVLATLDREPGYVYALIRAMQTEEGILGAESTLYPVLSRLLQSGLVKAEWKESAAGPPRKYFRLTPKGRVALNEFRTVWPQFSQAITSITSAEEGLK